MGRISARIDFEHYGKRRRTEIGLGQQISFAIRIREQFGIGLQLGSPAVPLVLVQSQLSGARLELRSGDIVFAPIGVANAQGPRAHELRYGS